MPRALDRCTNLFLLTITLLLTTVVAAQVTELPADCSAYASIPLPPEASSAPIPKSPPACASYRSYRGIGRPVNYVEARACAWQERLAKQADLRQNPNEPTAWVVGGPLILVDIYANGAGVPRNLPLAMRFACEFDDSAAKGAIQAIQKPETPPRRRRRFELCDYAWTTFTATFCTAYQAEVDDDRRSRYYNSLKSSMPPGQRAVFEKLLAAKDTYIDAHTSEVYQGGTIHNMRTLTSQKILKNLFHAELLHYEHGDWPPLTASQTRTADTLLQREYDEKLRELRARPTEEGDEGASVTAESLAGVEAAWVPYRKAWIAFARLRYPTHADAIAAQITLDRYRLIKTI